MRIVWPGQRELESKVAEQRADIITNLKAIGSLSRMLRDLQPLIALRDAGKLYTRNAQGRIEKVSIGPDKSTPTVELFAGEKA